jgi:chromosome segregation ATPase
MNRPKLTKKELAARADKFEEQLDRLKNRLNRYSYKKTKQGNRLELLRENTQALGQRLDHLDRQLARLAVDDDNLPVQWKKLQKQVRSLRQAVGEWQTQGQVETTDLTAGLQELQQKQQRLKADLRLMHKVIKRVSDGSDDLHRDSKELSKHVRNLEESSSELSLHQTAHDDRIRDLEETFAESSRQQEKRQRKEKEQAESEHKAAGKDIKSLQAELTLLRRKLSDGRGQQKDLKRRIEQLSNRIGELGGQLTALHGDLEHRLQSGEQRPEGIEQRLPELESRLESLQAAREQDSGIIDALELNQEKSLQLGQEMAQAQQALSEHLKRLEQHLEQIQTEDEQAVAGIQTLETRFQELIAEATRERSRVDGLEQGLEQGLNQSRADISQLQEELQQASLQQQQLEQQISTQGADGERREQQLGALTETTRTHSERLDSLDTAIEASGTRAKEQEQRTGEWIARLGATQSAAAKRLDAMEAATGGHDDSISRLHAELEQTNDTSSNQQQRIEAAHTSGLRHSMAIAALLIIGLLGGIALYQFLTQRISGIKRDVALSLTQQGGQYALRQQTEAQYQHLESALAETRQQREKLSADTTAPVGVADSARMDSSPADMVVRLEQRLAHNEERIGDLSALIADRAAVAPAPTAARPLRDAVTGIEREIAALQASVKDLQSSTQPDSELEQRAASLELSLSQVQEALEHRLQPMEREQEQRLEQQQLLSDRIDTLTRSVAALKQEFRLSSLPGQEQRWEQAVEIGQYSIQLLGMHNPKTLLAFAERYPLDGERAYALTSYKERKWYILLYGIFNNIQDAKAALDALPDSIKVYHPWIRELPAGLSFTSIP